MYPMLDLDFFKNISQKKFELCKYGNTACEYDTLSEFPYKDHNDAFSFTCMWNQWGLLRSCASFV